MLYDVPGLLHCTTILICCVFEDASYLSEIARHQSHASKKLPTGLLHVSVLPHVHLHPITSKCLEFCLFCACNASFTCSSQLCSWCLHHSAMQRWSSYCLHHSTMQPRTMLDMHSKHAARCCRCNQGQPNQARLGSRLPDCHTAPGPTPASAGGPDSIYPQGCLRWADVQAQQQAEKSGRGSMGSAPAYATWLTSVEGGRLLSNRRV